MPTKATSLSDGAATKPTDPTNPYAGVEVSVPFAAKFGGECGFCSEKIDTETPTTTPHQVVVVRGTRGKTVVHATCATKAGLPMAGRKNARLSDIL